jgi:cytochrome c oxidase cbb3-type subunit 4
MDVNQLRIVVTVLSFVAFLGLWVWAWSRKNQAGFDEAARLPFADSAANDQGERS